MHFSVFYFIDITLSVVQLFEYTFKIWSILQVHIQLSKVTQKI